MADWEAVRALARARRAEALGGAEGGALLAAEAVLARADALTGLARHGLPRGDALLAGAQAVLDPEAAIIWYDAWVEPRLAAVHQAHEYGHWWLHGGARACAASDLTMEAGEPSAEVGARRVEGYSPRERREREATVFAQEFLLPTELARAAFLENGLGPAQLAARAGLPERLVLGQLARGVLVGDLLVAGEAPAAGPRLLGELDPSQREAAYAPRGPLLVEAGPGTGKTRTLVARVLYLLEQAQPPESVLALTFSNRAAEELRERVAQVAPEAAPRIWMGTFHSFGLELLRKYGERLGLGPAPRVVDPVDALGLLEEALPELELEHYRNLYEPTLYLRDILQAISRAKDELAGPEDYARLAQAQLRAAEAAGEGAEAARLAAERALEVARVYARYQALLEARGLLDFGDLLARSVRLLREHPDVRERLRRQYRHLLVDEYQDVNRASALLLRELAGEGEGLWAVADARQAIYRFRGAAPRNVRRFARDFPGGRTLTLRRNYRSRPAIVALVAELAPRVGGSDGRDFTPWEAVRADEPGQVRLEVAEDGEAEGDGLAAAIERLRAAGVPYREQAVLGRSHAVLARVAARLERNGVPALYLGNLFERPEARDLLALLALVAEPDGQGLVRVAEFPDYRVPLPDVRAALAAARERGLAFPAALRELVGLDGLSEAGRRGLGLLAEHLAGLAEEAEPWGFLARYLFERSGYARRLTADGSVAGQQRRLAVYQLLQFAREAGAARAEAGQDPRATLLRYVRRLEQWGEERALRQVPEWAQGLEAVRLLTVHASKGLEFAAVYLPALAQGHFPAARRSQPCPPPAGLVDEEGADPHAEEEACLFFVALSRARDHLCLSRARRYGRQPRGPSELLLPLAAHLARSPDGPITWPRTDDTVEAPSPPAPLAGYHPAFRVELLDLYLRCPRQCYYEHRLGLGGQREASAYVQFHQCVYAVLRWLQAERGAGREVGEAAALARLAEVWQEQGPLGHAYEGEHRRAAEAMVARAVGHARGGRRWLVPGEWEVPLEHGRARLTPDHVEVEAGEPPRVTVRRLRTGRPSQSEPEKDVYALYQVGAERAFPDAERKVEVLYLSTDERQEVRLSPRQVATRLERYDRAIAGILRGEFPPAPSERDCPRCPHYFICPAG